MAGVARLGSGLPLIGRRQELAALEAALRRAYAGRAGAVLISGDAGVGKSRLLTELIELARRAGHVVLSGGCLDAADAALPYLPFVEALQQLSQLQPELVDNHPALARLLPDTHKPDTTHDRNLGQLQLFDALHSAIRELATEHTVLLAIEDLHWADRSSRDLLAFLLSRLSNQRLLVVGTFRADDLHRRHPLRPLLAELLRLPAVERLTLEPFGPDDAHTFVRRLAESEPGLDTLSEELIRDVAVRSEGNAFMAEELLSAASDRVPHELAEILLARVERLSATAQQVIRLAAVLGRRFSHRRISAAATELDEQELEQALWEAVAHHVLITEEADSYAFRHALLREAVYGDLLPGERTRLHARVADAMSGEDGPGVAAELAHHRMESHDLPGALQASWRAAREADELGAPAEALVHAERALKLWHAVPDAEAASGTDELSLTRWAAWAASASGEPDRALAHTRSAIALADALGDATTAADVRRRYANYQLFSMAGSLREVYDTALHAWQLVADSPPSEVKAWVQATLARAAASLDRYEEAIEHAAAAQRTARAVGGEGEHAAAEADALITMSGAVRRLGREDEALRRLATASELASKIGALDVELRARFQTAMIQMEAGNLRTALDEIDAAVHRAVSTGLTWSSWGLELRVLQVICRYMSGDWDGADAAASLAGETVSPTVATRVSAASLLVSVGRGRFDAAQRRLEQLRERWRTDTQVMRLLGLCGCELERWRGRPERAVEWIEQALQWLRHYEPWHLGEVSLCAVGVGGYADRAELARRVRDVAAEQAAVRAGLVLAQRSAEAMVNGRPQAGRIGPEALAWQRMVEAETSRLTGEHKPAVWREVVTSFGYGEIYRQAYARWRWAETLLAAGDRADRDEAADLLRQAAEVADQLGATPLRTAMAKLAKRARIPLDGAAELPVDTLTQREHAVLALVAAGRTNRQIGEELFISEKTVSVHLSRVMAKLGTSSRAETVSVAYDRGLLTASTP